MSRALLALGLGALPAAALEVDAARYSCDRGVEVPVVYVNGADGAAAAVVVEGRQIALVAEPAASGARYAWPSDGSGYVWATKGEEAVLLWRDGAAGTESTLLSGCARR